MIGILLIIESMGRLFTDDASIPAITDNPLSGGKDQGQGFELVRFMAGTFLIVVSRGRLFTDDTSIPATTDNPLSGGLTLNLAIIDSLISGELSAINEHRHYPANKS
ncbi:MAG: hypothetical protein KTR35_04445 [Gammaproteobacteria bacterium]|nr:hypothetical protein [Gammaproteobacteria bacterium]